MEEKYQIIKKISNYIINIMNGKSSQREDFAIQKWIETNPSSQKSLNLFSDSERLSQAVTSFKNDELRKKSVSELSHRLTFVNRRKKLIRASLRVASVIVGVTMILFTSYRYLRNETNQETGVRFDYVAEVPTLILDNGMDIRLDKVKNISGKHYGNVINKGEASLKYNNTDTIDYSEKLNTLIIPHKYIYNITLSDGTKVLLNANSKLIYPMEFKADKREIILDGEAFFEVTKGTTPFIVKCNGIDIKVYGTKFNVKSYITSSVETTLVSGSVGVSFSDKKENNEIMLRPNQLIHINVNRRRHQIKEVDAVSYTSWITGKINSYDSQLGDLTNKLANWYGLNFNFFDEVKRQIPITASFDNSQTIESIIDAIEFSAKVKIIKVEGGYIIY